MKNTTKQNMRGQEREWPTAADLELAKMLENVQPLSPQNTYSAPCFHPFYMGLLSYSLNYLISYRFKKLREPLSAKKIHLGTCGRQFLTWTPISPPSDTHRLESPPHE